MHSRAVSVIDTRPPRCCSWLHSCFAKCFTQIALAAAAPAGGNRGGAERRQRSGAASSSQPRPGTAALGFRAIPSAPGMRRLRCCRSSGWGSHPYGDTRDPHHRVTSAVSPVPCQFCPALASSPARLLVEPRGGTSPTSPRPFPTSRQRKSIIPSLRVSGVCVRPGNFASPAPPNPWGTAGGGRSGVLPRRNTAQRSDLGILLGFGRCQAHFRALRARVEEGSGYGRGGTFGFQLSPCLQPGLGVRAVRESAGGH